MARIKAEDILKPGAKMVVTEIDFNDPKIKKMIAEHHKACRELRRYEGWRYAGWWRRF